MKIGFIGLGIMGESMSWNIVKKHDDTVYVFDFVKEKAVEAGYGKIFLNVNKKNPAAAVYRHMGFQLLREEKNDIGNGFYMDDYVFLYQI